MKRAIEDDAISGFPEEERELVRLLIQAARDEIHADYEKAHSRYRTFLLHIRNNLTNPDLTVKTAIDSSNLSNVSTYAAEFKRIIGVRPREYIAHHRMQLARNLLQNTRTAVYFVAFAVGYKDPNLFSRNYKKKMCHAPTRESKADSISVARLFEDLKTSVQFYHSEAQGVSEDQSSLESHKTEAVGIDVFWNDIWQLKRQRAIQYIYRNLYSLDIHHFNFLFEKSKIEGRKDRKRGEELADISLDLLRAIEFSNRTELLEEKIKAYTNLGNARRLVFDLIGSREAFDVVDKLMPDKSATRMSLFLEVAFFKALLFWSERDIESAVEIVEEILPDLEKTATHDLLARSLQLAGLLYDCRGHVDRALLMFEESVKFTQYVKDPYIVLSAHYHLAYMYAKLAKIDQASELFEKVILLHREIGTGDSETHITLLRASILRAKGDLRTAEAAYLEAKEGYEALGSDIYVALTALEIALLYVELKDYDRALSMALSSIPSISQYSAHKEAIAALAILEEASKGGNINKSIIGQALNHIELVRRDRASAFVTQ